MIDKLTPTVRTARWIRPHVAETAPQALDELDGLIAAGSRGNDVDTAIEALLRGHPGVFALFVTRRDAEEGEKAVNPPPGPPGPISAQRFRCPACGWTWHRQQLGESIPPCGNCSTPLIRG